MRKLIRKYLLLLFLFGCSKPTPPAKSPPYVRIGKPVVCDTSIYLEYVGHVKPNLSVDIKAQVDGILTGQYFVEGQEVCENSLLMTIDPRPFQVELEKARAELAQNLATLEQARDIAKCYKELVELNYISQLDYDQILTNALTAEASVKQSQANVDRAQLNLDYCTIYAPFRGVTSKLQIDVGNYVSIGAENPLLTINQISPIRISFFVPEKDLPKIAALQAKEPLKVQVRRNDEWIDGRLFLINNTVDEKTGTILLQAIFDNQNQKLWPGEFVDVRLILKIEKNAVLIPSQAVTLGQNGPYIYVLNPDQTVELKNVKVGQKEKDLVIIENGISIEDQIVIEGQLNLNSGDKVLIKS